jgi:hypothetical protein
MNTYHAFYKNKLTHELKAASSYAAQLAAATFFKAKKSHEVTVVLVAVDDREIVHSTTWLS